MSNSTIPVTSSSTFSSAPSSTFSLPSSTEPSTSAASETSTSIFSSTSISSTTSSIISTTPLSSSGPVTFTSHVTVSPTGTDTTPTVVTVTSTASGGVITTTGNSAASASSSEAAASSSSRAAALATSGANSSNSGGLKSGGKIAIAVVVPIVAIAAIVAALIFFWKKRKARKNAEEERRKEVEEYGYNPNNDPTLPAVGSTYGETQSEMTEDNSGYRGWGATSTQRKPSTTLGSTGRGAIGMAVSDTNSNSGAYNSIPSEGNSGDPLVSGGDRPPTNESEPIGALGAIPASTSGQTRDLNRGPSNASSAYTGHRSEGSGDGDRPVNGSYGAQQYYDDANYYNDAQPNHGPYGDGSYGGGQGQPVIRDVQARRNTRIEKPSIFPQQGNAGIAQNF